MHRFLLVLTLLLGFTAPAAAQEPPKVTTLFSRDLSDMPGKEGTMLIVEYPPGGADPVHRHDAHAFVYDVPMTFTLSVATPAKRSPRSFSSSSLRTRVRPS